MLICPNLVSNRFLLPMVNPLNYIKAGTKYLLSLAKSDWTLTDYPIRFRNFNGSSTDASHGRLKTIPWSAQIINWWQMGGFGDTKQQAYADLETKFNKFKADERMLPRPGTGLP